MFQQMGITAVQGGAADDIHTNKPVAGLGAFAEPRRNASPACWWMAT